MLKVIFAAGFGNALEWFDFILYAKFYKMIALHFFPETEFSEILTMAVFAAGFLGRPIGAIAFGSIGDRFGRRIALIIGIITMALPTAAIGLLPSYNQIGITATIILILMRLMQGFSLGGEFSTCITYIVEHARIERRGVVGGTAFISMCLGMLFGSLAALSMPYFMSDQDLMEWGWRVPFLAGIVIGFVGLYVRLKLSESPLYNSAKVHNSLSASPIHDLFKYHWKNLLMGISIYITVTTPFFTSTVYVESLMKMMGYTSTESNIVGIAILITMMLVLPISSFLSDIFGRKFILITGILMIIIFTAPLLGMLGEMNFYKALISQIGYAAIIAWYMAPVPTLLVELFPTKVRLTGIALSYNVSAALFGGTAPMVAMLLQKFLDNQFAMSYYIIILAIFTLCTIRFYSETYRKPL
jgi:MHS family proline/betaine transporter-like MFS transporter